MRFAAALKENWALILLVIAVVNMIAAALVMDASGMGFETPLMCVGSVID